MFFLVNAAQTEILLNTCTRNSPGGCVRLFVYTHNVRYQVMEVLRCSTPASPVEVGNRYRCACTDYAHACTYYLYAEVSTRVLVLLFCHHEAIWLTHDGR